MSVRSEKERQIASVLLVVFSSLLFGMMIVEIILMTNTGTNSLWADFVNKSNIGFVMPYFLAYLVLGGVGLAGSVGLIHTYGSGQGFYAEFIRLSAVAYFTVAYWLWSAVWIVEHKLTLLTDSPTNPDDWVLQIYDSSAALWALPSWGSFGPSLVFFGGMAWLLSRGARLLPRAAAACFAFLALSRLVSLVYIGVSNAGTANTGQADFAFVNDALFNVLRIVAFLLAAASLLTEKGIFARKAR